VREKGGKKKRGYLKKTKKQTRKKKEGRIPIPEKRKLKGNGSDSWCRYRGGRGQKNNLEMLTSERQKNIESVTQTGGKDRKVTRRQPHEGSRKIAKKTSGNQMEKTRRNTLPEKSSKKLEPNSGGGSGLRDP